MQLFLLKWLKLKYLEKKKNVTPILILDDLFSELDEEKINNIMLFIDNDIQTFITTTELDKVNDELKKCKSYFLCREWQR